MDENRCKRGICSGNN